MRFMSRVWRLSRLFYLILFFVLLSFWECGDNIVPLLAVASAFVFTALVDPRNVGDHIHDLRKEN